MNHRLAPAESIPNPTEYIVAMLDEYFDWAFDPERAEQLRGQWRERVFSVDESHPLDVEIGTGNGYHFAHYAKTNPERAFVGLEYKFKPLIQSIRRALRDGSTNSRVIRHDARQLCQMFNDEEINHLIIHHPDPWPKKRHWKNRLIQLPFLQDCFRLQRAGSYLEFKTDSLDYFQWAMDIFEKTGYELEYMSYDFHNTEESKQHYITHFENLFLKQGITINYAKFVRK